MFEAAQTLPNRGPALGMPVQSTIPQPVQQGILQAMDNQTEGFAVMDEDANLAYANPIAHRIFVQREWLQANGTVCSQRSGEREPWMKALRLACRAQARSLVELSGGQGSLFVAVMPIAAGQDGHALVILGRPGICGPAALRLFAEQHGLTPTECEVLHTLCKGHKPATIARLQGVALSTVISQLAAIRTKTLCADLRELLCKIACLPALPAMGWEGAVH